MAATNQVSVSVQSFTSLFAQARFALDLDSYQRPYVWGQDKITQLLADLRKFLRPGPDAAPRLDYYMGVVLLHENQAEQRLFIIDGQQRLTALSILLHALTGKLPPNHALHYRSPESARNIKLAQACCGDVAPTVFTPDLFDRISFTVITVASADLAFTFFDTQNNRGMPLNATDLLKAYHLRAIDGSQRDALQQESARRWERLQGQRQILGNGADFAPTLFHQFLWRARRWTGQKVIARESHDDIIAEFQLRTLASNAADRVPLYAARNNRLATSLSVSPQGGHSLVPCPIPLTQGAADLPFAIRQPISRGLGFFLYADKYAALTEALLAPDSNQREALAFQDFYRRVVADLSVYLRELFLLASVMFVDQFGLQPLLRFTLWLDYALGAIRIDKQYIFKEAPLIYLRDAPLNLLDVIAGAFRPEQVIEHLQQDANAQRVYASEAIEAGKGVQGAYKQRLLDYYARQGNLQRKAVWIEEKLA